jgi:hypothetical protein
MPQQFVYNASALPAQSLWTDASRWSMSTATPTSTSVRERQRHGGTGRPALQRSTSS